jgi:hypothetical protein
LGSADGEKRDLIRVRGLLGRALAPQNYGNTRQEDARQPCILPAGVLEHNP